MGPSKSAYSMVDGGPALELVLTEVRPRRSRTVASYCRLSMRRSWVVAGIPGTHVMVPLPESPPEPVPFPPPLPLSPVLMPLTLPVQPSQLAASNPQRPLRTKRLMWFSMGVEGRKLHGRFR